jgi:hypothetical protein
VNRAADYQAAAVTLRALVRALSSGMLAGELGDDARRVAPLLGRAIGQADETTMTLAARGGEWILGRVVR